ncbi:BsuPI-related putative proteinase inhibitor [Bacillus sp. CLL-7-23]|uniref:Intracellular proteinase inhibitor BsuPI domain-containing protein n=1 Tax=Bacillus changyiensis TaxID=3004103 RepID=A0ABT4X1L6_9BACI|nr:BsuPI-related putative proteinase inhibitor [Bacillus changyiensis]MDA7026063.1 BsuPI-related putative proteinase inhibitor [Bacillus changyiensis]
MRIIALIMLLFVGGCNQIGENHPDKEVTGEMSKGVVLSVEPVQKQGKVEFNMSVKNNTDKTVEFHFNSGQKFELTVVDEKGNEVYRYSEGKVFTQVLETMKLKPGESYDFKDVWTSVPGPGKYSVNVTFLGRAELSTLQERKTFTVK